MHSVFSSFFQPFVLELPAQNLLAAAFKADWKSDKGRRSPGFSFKGSTLNTRSTFPNSDLNISIKLEKGVRH